MKTVLFLGASNSTRTQMAEAILRKKAGDQFDAHSAGMRPTEIHPMTQRVLAEIGIDTDSLAAKDLGRFLGRKTLHYAIILSQAEEPDGPRIYPFALSTLSWPTDDPVEAEGDEWEQLASFRRVRDAIDLQIESWLAGELAFTTAS